MAPGSGALVYQPCKEKNVGVPLSSLDRAWEDPVCGNDISLVVVVRHAWPSPLCTFILAIPTAWAAFLLCMLHSYSQAGATYHNGKSLCL